MATVLVTDGEQRAALAVVRSLGRAGHRVIVTAPRAKSLAGSSRYAAASVVVTDPLTSPAEFVAQVAAAVSEWKVQVLLPITDASLLAIQGAAQCFPGIVRPFPPLERILAAADKAALMAHAPKVGIRVPTESRLEGKSDRQRISFDTLRFPLVIKPARSVVTEGAHLVKLGVMHAATISELQASLERIPASGYPVLLQQRITGPGVGIFLLIWKGETVARFAHRRIREKPPSGGVSVYRESIAADPALVAQSRALLDSLGWEGVAMIEYKIGQDGAPYLMEINGRFWGSLQLAVDAGVDFPALLVALGLGQQVAPVNQYREGIRLRWWWGDVDHLLARLQKSRARLSLPPDSPGRLSAILQFARVWRPGDRNEIFRWDDPMPLLRESIEWIRGR